MNFTEKLLDSISKTNSHVCLGIDPSFSALPPFFRSEIESTSRADFTYTWGKCLLETFQGKIPAVKFQSAYFESMGAEGVACLARLFEIARSKGYFTIYDAKRGDISSTMKAYGETAFDYFGADCMTITPYMGTDVLEPLLPWFKKGKGCYLVWHTSNISANAIQLSASIENSLINLVQREFSSFLIEADLLQSMGLVLGLTKINDIELSSLIETPLLLPGFGPQNGTITPDLRQRLQRHPFDLIPSSRALTSLGDMKREEDLQGLKSWEDYKLLVTANLTALSKALTV